jgi:hypothetical protein
MMSKNIFNISVFYYNIKGKTNNLPCFYYKND